uniref:(northern house mosquito) hypothetical protein n=1 Tax=Culex pipiens TaxID=7175 RepID=A0A8D8J463_CULPI
MVVPAFSNFRCSRLIILDWSTGLMKSPMELLRWMSCRKLFIASNTGFCSEVQQDVSLFSVCFLRAGFVSRSSPAEDDEFVLQYAGIESSGTTAGFRTTCSCFFPASLVTDSFSGEA